MPYHALPLLAPETVVEMAVPRQRVVGTWLREIRWSETWADDPNVMVPIHSTLEPVPGKKGYRMFSVNRWPADGVRS